MMLNHYISPTHHLVLAGLNGPLAGKKMHKLGKCLELCTQRKNGLEFFHQLCVSLQWL